MQPLIQRSFFSRDRGALSLDVGAQIRLVDAPMPRPEMDGGQLPRPHQAPHGFMAAAEVKGHFVQLKEPFVRDHGQKGIHHQVRFSVRPVDPVYTSPLHY
jgi:hypothetical protein